MNYKLTQRVKWTWEKDNSYFGMWAVHPVADTSDQSNRRFYFLEEGDAKEFIRLVDKSCHRTA